MHFLHSFLYDYYTTFLRIVKKHTVANMKLFVAIPPNILIFDSIRYGFYDAFSKNRIYPLTLPK